LDYNKFPLALVNLGFNISYDAFDAKKFGNISARVKLGSIAAQFMWGA
jgi:hypothetical protein